MKETMPREQSGLDAFTVGWICENRPFAFIRALVVFALAVLLLACNVTYAHADTKVLPYSAELIGQIGNQKYNNSHNHEQCVGNCRNSPQESCWCCQGYALAYARSMIDGFAQSHVNFMQNKTCGLGLPGSANFRPKTSTSEQVILKYCYDSINDNRPVIVHVKQRSGGEHWVTVIGYQNVTDTSNLKLDNFVTLEPYYGTEKSLGIQSSLFWEDNKSYKGYRLLYTTDRVNDHTHSWHTTSVTWYNDQYDTVALACDDCGETKSQLEYHSYHWSGDMPVKSTCSKCGWENVSYDVGKKGYFVRYDEIAIRDEMKVWGSNSIGTIPANTVLHPTDIGLSIQGNWMGKVTYKGVTGWVWLHDLYPNNTGGVHTYVNGVCPDDGVPQVATEPGTYKLVCDDFSYVGNPDSEKKRVHKKGETVTVTRVEVSSFGYLWGQLSDGSLISMEHLDYHPASSDWLNGTVTTSVSEGIYNIISVSQPSTCLDVAYGSTDSGTNVQAHEINGADAQKFELRANSDGTYAISFNQTDMLLDVWDCDSADGTNVAIHGSNGGANQKWYIESTSDGYYSFRSAANNKYLTVVPSGTGDANIAIYSGTKSSAQKFSLKMWRTTIDPNVDGPMTAEGIKASYAYTGNALTPKPSVVSLRGDISSLRVPESGTWNTQYAFTSTIYLEAGETYRIEGSVTKLTGSTSKATFLVYDWQTESPDACYGADVEYDKPFSVTLTPSAYSQLLFYAGQPGSTWGCAVQ